MDLPLRVALSLLPVACFLGALLALDSYQMVRLRQVLLRIACGAGAALAAYWINYGAVTVLDLRMEDYARYVAPIVEEALKGAILVVLLRTNRIAFLVDAAICGFAVGTGFAMLENAYYLGTLRDATIGTWVLRGFGTAIMHGGASAIFGVAAVAFADRRARADLSAFLPGFALAFVLHSAFNHFFGSPVYSAVGILLVLPPLLALVFRTGERAVEQWLGSGFDSDTELLELINSGRFSQSPVGTYLHDLRRRFRGEVIADLLCYLRLQVELGLRAKGVLMLRDEGLDPGVDEATRDKLEELRYLERSVGPTALLALKPFRHRSRKELWQLFMLDG